MAETPPPPPDYPSFGNGAPESYDNGESLDAGRPTVAANPGRILVVVGAVGAVLLFLLFNLFSGGDDDDAAPPPVREVASTPIEPPAPPPVAAPIAPPPTLVPPTIPEPTRVELIQPQDDAAARQQAQARLRSEMLVTDNSGGLGSLLGGGSAPPAALGDDPNSQFEAQVLAANTKAERAVATHIGDLRRTIAQGRIIQATLETAINTDLPGPIRAIISRDTFGEAGTAALLPKGSRLIGRYSTDLSGGQSRVFVIWTRAIRPDGVDVMLGSPLVDQIGQAGVGGQVDTKFQQIFSRAILASIVTIGFAIGSDEITGGGDTSTSTSTFGTTQSGDGATTATVNALNRLGAVTEAFLRRFIDAGPTILVDQGTPVNVFVNRDLVFPAEISGTRMIQ